MFQIYGTSFFWHKSLFLLVFVVVIFIFVPMFQCSEITQQILKIFFSLTRGSKKFLCALLSFILFGSVYFHGTSEQNAKPI